MSSPILLSPLTIRDLTLKNRIAISPMCQYCAVEGVVDDWHLVHLGRFALGGAALVMVEATSVGARGRITPGDVGLWNTRQARALSRVASFLQAHGSAAGIQLCHAGRKASSQRPWDGGAELTDEDEATGEKSWETWAPSAIPYAGGYRLPKPMSVRDIHQVIGTFYAAARRAHWAGFDVLEIHAAHGYLLHEFLSPLSNHRTDKYGGDQDRRMRFPLEVIEAVRAAWPAGKPLFLRVSASDYVEGGLTIEDTVAFAKAAKARGVDLVDCSSGGNTPTAPTVYPGYQVPYAAEVRRRAEIATMAVGQILDGRMAEEALTAGSADLIAIGRSAMDDPNFAIHASAALLGEANFELAPTSLQAGLKRLASSRRHARVA